MGPARTPDHWQAQDFSATQIKSTELDASKFNNDGQFHIRPMRPIGPTHSAPLMRRLGSKEVRAFASQDRSCPLITERH